MVLLLSLPVVVRHLEATPGQLGLCPSPFCPGPLPHPRGPLPGRVTRPLMWWHRAPQTAKVGATRTFKALCLELYPLLLMNRPKSRPDARGLGDKRGRQWGNDQDLEAAIHSPLCLPACCPLFLPPVLSGRQSSHPHFTNGETEAQGGSIIVPRARTAGERWTQDLNPGGLAPSLSPEALGRSAAGLGQKG